MIILPTPDPAGLLDAMRTGIDEKRIRSWSYDPDGDFTHTAEQWSGRAWLHPSLAAGRLEMFIVPPRDTKISRATYAVLHGRFIEMALRHFDNRLSAPASASPFPEGDDIVG